MRFGREVAPGRDHLAGDVSREGLRLRGDLAQRGAGQRVLPPTHPAYEEVSRDGWVVTDTCGFGLDQEVAQKTPFALLGWETLPQLCLPAFTPRLGQTHRVVTLCSRGITAGSPPPTPGHFI